MWNHMLAPQANSDQGLHSDLTSKHWVLTVRQGQEGIKMEFCGLTKFN